MTRWAWLAGAIAGEVLGTLSLRATVDHVGWVSLVVVSYPVAFTLLGLSLRAGVPVGVAYGIWGAAGVALTATLGALIFGEALGVHAIAGLGLIIVGVVLVQTGSPHPGTQIATEVTP